jgi:hypothetical protein
VRKITWYWHKNKHKDQWNRGPRNKTTSLQPSDLWHKSQRYTGEKDSFFSKCIGETAYPHAEYLKQTYISYSVQKSTLSGLKILT